MQSLLVEILFKTFCTLFLIARLGWIAFHLTAFPAEEYAFVFNRLAFAFYFSCFTQVVFFWAENAHRTIYGGGGFSKSMAILFILVNLGVWVFQIVVMVFFVRATDSQRKNDLIYAANNIADVSLSLLVSLGFLLYGFVWARNRFKSTDSDDPRRCRDVVKIIGTTTVFAICFLTRFLMFCWTYMTGDIVDPDVFLVMTFFVPESVSVGLQVYLVESSKSKADTKAAFIEDLYQGVADVTFEQGIDPRYRPDHN